MKLAIPIVCSLLVLGTAASAATAPERHIACGGFPLPLDTTIGAAGSSPAHQTARSVIGLAAVIPADDSDYTPRAWMVWDEKGMAWLGLRQTSPPALRRLWAFPTPPDFYGPGVQVRFTPMKRSLPAGYKLASCPDVSGATIH